jgi:uncharacterized protein (UPF0264 family)
MHSQAAPRAIRLLVSVRDPAEAHLAAAAGAHLVDAKDPAAGALGALSPSVIRAIVEAVGDRAITSAVAGGPETWADLSAWVRSVASTGVGLVKVALPRREGGMPVGLSETLRSLPCPVVAALFAEDYPTARAVPDLAAAGFSGAMIDTRTKNGRRLPDLMTVSELDAFLRRCKEHGLMTGLAGSLRISDIRTLAPLGPDYLGFRGGLCEAGNRRAALAAGRIADALREIASVLPVPACA